MTRDTASRRTWAWLIATLCGAGHAPVAPGTVGSVLVAGAWWLAPSSLSLHLALLIAWIVAGTFAADAYAKQCGNEDPSQVVVDEAAGMWLTLIGLPKDPLTLLAGVLLFRVFDVIKPFGIRRLERLPGGLGIMADDLAAGLLARLIMQWAVVNIVS